MIGQQEGAGKSETAAKREELGKVGSLDRGLLCA